MPSARSRSIRAARGGTARRARRAGLQPHFDRRAGFRSRGTGSDSPGAERGRNARAVEEARGHGFVSVNFDLIYGSAQADPERIRRDARQGARSVARPYRALQLRPSAERVQAATADQRCRLPAGEQKLQLLTLAIGRLTRAGYLYIGMDHFARPNDDLAVAQRQGALDAQFHGLPDTGRRRRARVSASRPSARSARRTARA